MAKRPQTKARAKKPSRKRTAGGSGGRTSQPRRSEPQTPGRARGTVPSTPTGGNRLLIWLLVLIIAVLLAAFAISINLLSGSKDQSLSSLFGIQRHAPGTGPGAGPQIVSDLEKVPEDKYLIINCMPDPTRGLWRPQVSKEDGWYYVKVQLLETGLNKQEALELADEFTRAQKGTKTTKERNKKIAEVQERYLPDKVKSYPLEAGPFTRAGYKEFIGRMWTIMVRLRHGTVDVKDNGNGRNILTTSYPNALIKVQMFEPEWEVEPLDKRQGEIAEEMNDIFNTIMQNEADDELDETRRWKDELRRD